MPDLLDIVGQDAAVSRLQRALTGQRTPHAFLFAGPEGVGRRTTALALAQTLLCEQPVTLTKADAAAQRAARPDAPAASATFLPELPDDTPLRRPCGTCPACRMALAGTHPDLHLVYKELAAFHDDPEVRNRKMQALGIDVVQSFLIDPAGRAASRGRGKVFIVREAELMSTDAQNALLKTLEEPPPGVTIVLLCQRPEQMLPTTLSRCRLVWFGLLPEGFVTARLTAEGVAAGEAHFWAAFTGGSLGRAQRLAQAGMYEVKQRLVGQVAALPLAGDAELGEQLAKTMDKLAAEEVARNRDATDAELAKTVANRRAASILLQVLSSAYRDAMARAVGADLPAVHADQADAIDRLAGRFTPEQLAGIIEQLSDYERLLWRNVNPKTVWDNVVITCASAAPLGV